MALARRLAAAAGGLFLALVGISTLAFNRSAPRFAQIAIMATAVGAAGYAARVALLRRRPSWAASVLCASSTGIGAVAVLSGGNPRAILSVLGVVLIFGPCYGSILPLFLYAFAPPRAKRE